MKVYLLKVKSLVRDLLQGFPSSVLNVRTSGELCCNKMSVCSAAKYLGFKN